MTTGADTTSVDELASDLQKVLVGKPALESIAALCLVLVANINDCEQKSGVIPGQAKQLRTLCEDVLRSLNQALAEP